VVGVRAIQVGLAGRELKGRARGAVPVRVANLLYVPPREATEVGADCRRIKGREDAVTCGIA